jgi:UPF0716 family protein affecting phage T7 exclusion
MALTEAETHGTIVPGLVTDLDGNLVWTTDETEAAYGVVPGFLTDPDGRLVVTGTVDDAAYVGGFLRSPTGALIMVTEESPTYGVTPGFVTDTDGFLAVEVLATTTWQEGFLRDNKAALSLAEAPS